MWRSQIPGHTRDGKFKQAQQTATFVPLIPVSPDAKYYPLAPFRKHFSTLSQNQDHEAFVAYATNPQTFSLIASGIQRGTILPFFINLTDLLLVRDYFNLRSCDPYHSLKEKLADKNVVIAYNDLAIAMAKIKFGPWMHSSMFPALRLSFYDRHATRNTNLQRTPVSLHGYAQFIWLRDVSQTLLHQDFTPGQAKIAALQKLLTYPEMDSGLLAEHLQYFYFYCAKHSLLEPEHLTTLCNMLSALDILLTRLENNPGNSKWGQKYSASIMASLTIFKQGLETIANQNSLLSSRVCSSEREALFFYHKAFEFEAGAMKGMQNEWSSAVPRL